LTTRDIADRLGVSTGFIVGEIRDGRLAALQLRRTGKRTVYRVSEADFDAYVARHWMPASDRPSA
jgi:excisionase family DNA binding protein